MQKQLEEIKKRYDTLGALLSQPDAAADPQRLQTLSREHARYRPIVQAFDQHTQCTQELQASRDLLRQETDPAMQQMIRDELAALEQRQAELTQTLQVFLLPKDPNDERNVVLEIRAGTGGEEAGLFASELFRMYSRYAEGRGWKVEVLDASSTGLGGFKEVIALIQGDHVYSTLKFESGVHRVQRVPKTETSGRIHTSAVTVAVLPEAEEVDVAITEAELRIDVFRASGPGGQGVNTTDSAVRITHVPTGLVVVCREERSQIKNRARAMKLLRTRLLEQRQQAQESAMHQERKQQIGSGDRSEKIRTYNFSQNRVTDHRIGKTVHQLEAFLEGHIDDMLQALQADAQTRALQQPRI